MYNKFVSTSEYWWTWNTQVIASFISYFLQNTQLHHSTHHTFCWLPPTPQVPSCVVLSILPAHKVRSRESIVNTEENLEMSHIMENAAIVWCVLVAHSTSHLCERAVSFKNVNHYSQMDAFTNTICCLPPMPAVLSCVFLPFPPVHSQHT